ncbi:hypothetical protein MUCCIDRAFT_111635 [Mucor lusitanicus CBS 277.49]|uniref:Major facilitator superfamily (MFS) profile domain-containing protein n=1 Tax=Mucor lusitanicus CBS 277.49 TaxID=747725 RepID=A0A168KD50_MUCCL|nr:hypothetical protein MUCCIDRAFT_111635 [Mucor lusitanicus CBS 277.49]
MGPAWTYRILGCICLLMNTIACIFIKERVRYSTDKKKILNIQVLNNNNFLLFCIAADLIMFGYFVPLFLLPENATYLGLSDTQGSSCVIVCCAMSFIGRIITGWQTQLAHHIQLDDSYCLFAHLALRIHVSSANDI